MYLIILRENMNTVQKMDASKKIFLQPFNSLTTNVFEVDSAIRDEQVSESMCMLLKLAGCLTLARLEILTPGMAKHHEQCR